ncbi:MAG: tRNA ((7)-)-methyltransferase [Spartobacteria bacterium]|nr:tRNA ((7)-)-methyltransferase [Spartobacteria bacterium]
MIELLPETNATRLDLPELFGRTAPLQVDLGCGDGSFVRRLAAQLPQKDFLGVERLLHRVRAASRKTAGLKNVQVLRSETAFVVRNLLPPNSVEAFYLLFPDPWPKRRHHRRRLVTEDFLASIGTALTENGSLIIATDHAEYFARIRELAAKSKELIPFESTAEHEFPMSTFEKRFRDAGIPVQRLELRKTCPVM